MMLDTLADYAMGMEKGVSQPDVPRMKTYAANMGKVMSGDYTAMSSSGLKFTEDQKAIIQGEAAREQIVSVLGEEYLGMSSEMQAAAVITQVVDQKWAGMYETMSNTPEGQMMQMTKRLLKLKAVPRPDDAADALALAICHARSFTSRLPRTMNVRETV
ncbi:MAG: hypothetical protein HDT19_06885 [Oscillibacter sp.]|nr:hypothetical protein [Oscillibacter sp.]